MLRLLCWYRVYNISSDRPYSMSMCIIYTVAKFEFGPRLIRCTHSWPSASPAASKQIKRSFYRIQCHRVFDNHLYKSENTISFIHKYNILYNQFFSSSRVYLIFVAQFFRSAINLNVFRTVYILYTLISLSVPPLARISAIRNELD